MSGAYWVLIGAGWVCQILTWLRRMEMFWPAAVFAVACAVGGALAAARGDTMSAAILLPCAVVNALAAWFWWNRRKRRRAPRTLGAKSRARIAAMVTRMRERAARPALRPAPGGAR